MRIVTTNWVFPKAFWEVKLRGLFRSHSGFFWKISMVDIDEILGAAIRTAWLEMSGPESRSPHHIEVETARRVRRALEREGIIITPSRPIPEAALYEERRNSG